jgi:site-specific recombinase XerD
MLGQIPLPLDSPSADLARDGPILGPPADLSEAITRYSAHLSALGRAGHTVRSSRFDLTMLAEYLGNPTVGSVSAAHLRAHIQWLEDQRHNRSSSLRRKIATIKGFFTYAHASDWCATDAARGLVYPPLSRTPLVVLTRNELDDVIAAAGDPVWYALVLLLVDAGLKRDELLALQPHDLLLARDPSQSRVIIRHTAQSKRLRRRALPLTPRLHAALTRLLVVPLPNARLFDLSVRGVNFIVETVGQRARLARLRKLTPEILRDTFAVREMETRVRQEQDEAAAGASRDVVARLCKQHDLEVLELLGLSRHSEMALRYRAAALSRAGSPDAPPAG